MEKTLAIVGAGRALAPVKECGAAVGSMHPLQTFSGVGVPDLEGFAVEGDVVAVRLEANRPSAGRRSEEHTSELQSRLHLVCRLLLEKKKKMSTDSTVNTELGAHTVITSCRHNHPPRHVNWSTVSVTASLQLH